MIDSISSPPLSQASGVTDRISERRDALRSVAAEFEAVFLAEMLSHTSLAKTSESFGGGAGEDAFKSMLTRQWAEQLTEKGGVGLTETIFQALIAREGGDV